MHHINPYKPARLLFIVCILIFTTSCAPIKLSDLLSDPKQTTVLKEALQNQSTHFAEKVGRSTVGIIALAVKTTDGNPVVQQSNMRAIGTGVYIKSPYVLSNAHILNPLSVINPATSLDTQKGKVVYKVYLSPGESYEAELYNLHPTEDLGILRLIDPPDILTPVVFGDSDQVKIAQDIYALGNPFGVFGILVKGIVSKIGQKNPINPDSREMLVINADINPGNSGGPLFDTQGRVIGIMAISRLYSGIAMAITSNTVTDYLKTKNIEVPSA